MAGWSKRVGGSCAGSLKVHRNAEETKPWLDQEPLLKGAFGIKAEEEEKEYNREKVESLFNELLPLLLDSFFGGLCFRPLPPMIGDGQSVDLFQLYLNVRKRGGYEKVSENGQWDSVAKECGFDTIVGSSLKLVYKKYLSALCRCLDITLEVKDPNSGIEPSGLGLFGGLRMDLESDLNGCLSGISDEKKKNVEPADVEFNAELGFECDVKLSRFDEHEVFVKLNGNAMILEKRRFVQDGDEVGNESVVTEKGNTDGKDEVVVIDNDHLKRTDASDMVLDYSDEKEDVYSRKRRHDCSYSMMNWIKRLAMDPCDPEIGSLPDSSKWKYYASDLLWKQVLLVRQAMLSKRKDESSVQQAILQKKQKMHPTMYDDQSERQRFSQRLLASNDPSRKSRARICSETSSSATWSDDEIVESPPSDSSVDSDRNFVGSRQRKKRIPLGPQFQADIPEWTGKTYESDSKWLGTRLWPLEKAEQNRNLIERERVGKGRLDSCGCQFPGSFECVGFHISEKRKRLKLELGLAFYRLKFNNMGEEVAICWTREEEKKFYQKVESNPSSLGKGFWHEVVKSFPSRGRESLVSYYYNVFLLKRRGRQNRITPNDINSDDEESEVRYSAAVPPGSIFCSPKKSPKNAK